MEGATLPLLKGAGGEKHFDAEGGKSHRPRQIYRGWEEKDEEEEEGYRSTESSANPDPIIVPLIFFPLSFFLFTNREEEERYRTISSTFERKFFEILVVRPRYVRDTLSLSSLISLSRRRSPPEVREERKGGKKKKGVKNWRDHPIRRRHRVVLFPTSFLDLASRFIETRE